MIKRFMLQDRIKRLDGWTFVTVFDFIAAFLIVPGWVIAVYWILTVTGIAPLLYEIATPFLDDIPYWFFTTQ